MTYLANEAHIKRTLKEYSGPWAGEIHQVLDAYFKLADKHRRMTAAAAPLLDCEGDLQAVHIPHAMFSAFREAMGDQ